MPFVGYICYNTLVSAMPQPCIITKMSYIYMVVYDYNSLVADTSTSLICTIMLDDDGLLRISVSCISPLFSSTLYVDSLNITVASTKLILNV